MGEELDVCNTSLGLGIGDGFVGKRESDDRMKNKNKRGLCLDLSFPLYLKEKEEVVEEDVKELVREYMNSEEDGSIGSKTIEEDEDKTRERSDCDNNNNNSSNNSNNNNGSRKKLRLTKEQSTLLEDSFKLHTTLNTGQKQALAEKLNLLPRQVEVWFQNRRARTKLKQTEVDCEFLKKCCESLSDENRRLKKELQELRSLKMDQPQTSSSSSLYIQFPTTTMLCPSCEKIVKAATGGVGGGGDGKNGFPEMSRGVSAKLIQFFSRRSTPLYTPSV